MLSIPIREASASVSYGSGLESRMNKAVLCRRRHSVQLII